MSKKCLINYAETHNAKLTGVRIMGNEIGMLDPRINATDEELKPAKVSTSSLNDLLVCKICSEPLT